MMVKGSITMAGMDMIRAIKENVRVGRIVFVSRVPEGF